MFLTGKTVKSTVNEPFGKTMGTFFGKIQGVPTGYLIGTPWSHHLENCKRANHFCTGNTVKKLEQKILNVLTVYQVGIVQVHCPCPHNVFMVYQTGKLGFVPSDIRPLSNSRICQSTQKSQETSRPLHSGHWGKIQVRVCLEYIWIR
jgi:hypothetical protein